MYIAYGSYETGGTPTMVKKWDGSTWTLLTPGGIASSSAQIKMVISSSDVLYVCTTTSGAAARVCLRVPRGPRRRMRMRPGEHRC